MLLLLLLLEGPEGPDPLPLELLVPATLSSPLSALSPGSPEGAEVGPGGLLGDGSEGSSFPDSVEAGRAMVMVSASCHMRTQRQLVCSPAAASRPSASCHMHAQRQVGCSRAAAFRPSAFRPWLPGRVLGSWAEA